MEEKLLHKYHQLFNELWQYLKTYSSVGITDNNVEDVVMYGQNIFTKYKNIDGAGNLIISTQKILENIGKVES